MKQSIKSYILPLSLLALILSATSCGSSQKGIIKGNNIPEMSAFSPDAYFSLVKSNDSKEKDITAKINVTISSGSKSMSTNGTLKMKKDDVIQVSLVDPILGMMEVGRMEFTRSKVLVIDRINKQYIDVPYEDVDFLKKANIDFNTLQSLFWNEVFEPGNKQPKASAFTYKDNGDGSLEMGYTDKILAYSFDTEKQTGILNKTKVTDTKSQSYQMRFDYGNFTDFEGNKFPKELTLSFTSGTKSASLAFKLSSIKNSSDWVARTSIPAKYQKASPEKILKMLVK
ncbi:MAG: DUF4292 domain-containing protein [Bacteroides sp.]|nr:DUF4292 domain-containing protein [Roseburia sp.]MCM1346057.1 DUF4292 domain-containing protein [Bacteroides sp.]MCM1420579.1 DUF4292 domain-containing protein [Bacteroides sp.]